MGSVKSDVHPDLIGLFRSKDRNIVQGTKHTLPIQMRRWLDTLKDDEDVSAVFYRAPLAVVRDRLELKGYTLAAAKSAFKATCFKQVKDIDDEDAEDTELGEYQRARYKALTKLEPDGWIQRLQAIRTQRSDGSAETETVESSSMFDIYDSDWYGYAGPDLNVPLRLAIEACEPDDEFIYDLTDLVLQGYYSTDDDFVSDTLRPEDDIKLTDGKRIVLTEGKSDTWIISESLRLLYPNIADYFAFMDFELAKVGGGAGNLANIVRAFAGAGILNRVIALFDNDTAAEAAIRSLRGLQLPEHIKVLTMPALSALENYPTIGPSGPVTMNVNGVAGSIELYLGKDCLADENGNLAPIHWTGYEAGVGKYQGEVHFKDRIHERFKQKLERCASDAAEIERVDWSGIREIVGVLCSVFHALDSRLINELAIIDLYAE